MRRCLSAPGGLQCGVLVAMLKRDRGKLGSDLILVVAIGFLIALWSVFVWGLSAQNAYRTYAGQERAERYESDRHSAECARAWFLLDPCTPGQIEAEGDGDTAEYDLAAQNKMADWAALMVLVSGAGFLASVVGIYLIRETLIETRKANEGAGASANAAQRAARATYDAAAAAREANEHSRVAHLRDIRPWLRVVPDNSSTASFTETDMIAIVGFAYENIGKTPATEVRATGKAYSAKGEIDMKALMKRFIVEELEPQLTLPIDEVVTPTGSGWINPMATISLDQTLCHQIEEGIERHSAIVIFGVTYQSLYQDRTFAFARAYLFYGERRTDGLVVPNRVLLSDFSRYPGGSFVT